MALSTSTKRWAQVVRRKVRLVFESFQVVRPVWVLKLSCRVFEEVLPEVHLALFSAALVGACGLVLPRVHHEDMSTAFRHANKD